METHVDHDSDHLAPTHCGTCRHQDHCSCAGCATIFPALRCCLYVPAPAPRSQLDAA